jgi:hypothetical protein
MKVYSITSVVIILQKKAIAFTALIQIAIWLQSHKPSICLTSFTAHSDQTRHKKGRRAKPRNGFSVLICGGFESKLL